MDFLFKRNWNLARQILAELKTNWRRFTEQETGRNKLKMLTLVYMNAVFFLALLASWYVCIVFILVGVGLGIFLGATVDPFYLFMLFLPFAGLLVLKLTQLFWTHIYLSYQEEFLKK